jgi:hypothetical protein
MTMPEFHRLEKYDNGRTHIDSQLSIQLTFETERFGYLQTRVTRMEDKYHGEVINTWKFGTLDSEPDLNMFTNEQVHHMEKVARIVWRMVYDAPAKKERFE